MTSIINLQEFSEYDKPSENLEVTVIYIFCEGEKREYQYFKNFNKECNIKVEVFNWKDYNKEDPENNKITNSPQGLLDVAKRLTTSSEDNPNPKYEVLNEDEVWLVFDTDRDKTDTRRSQIIALRNYCKSTKNWQPAQSNPSIEVWFYYHHFATRTTFYNIHLAKQWKTQLNNLIQGGFNSKNHCKSVKQAIENAEKNFTIDEHSEPIPASTEVFKLATKICELVDKEKSA